MKVVKKIYMFTISLSGSSDQDNGDQEHTKQTVVYFFVKLKSDICGGEHW